jgi:(p)ppGpp synthase/HD superfamily hydrolase
LSKNTYTSIIFKPCGTKNNPTLSAQRLRLPPRHQGQFDKAGAPYILHPLRLMFRLQDTNARIVAVLHDVVEDTDIALDDVCEQGFSEEVISAVDALTRRNGETYEEFTERIVPNALARTVKIEDLRDNLNLTRVQSLSEDGVNRIHRYHKALARLLPLQQAT